MGDTVFLSKDNAMAKAANQDEPLKNATAEDRQVLGSVKELAQRLKDEGVEGTATLVVNKTLMAEMAGIVDKRIRDVQDKFPALVENCPYEVRLAIVAWVFDQLCLHARDPGTFRHLIYERLGFEHDAYLPLQMAGGLEISNNFRLGGVPKGEVQ